MTLEEYEYVEPDCAVADALAALAALHPALLDDLLSALEAFVERDCESSCEVASEKKVTIYLEPPRFVIRHYPAPAVLVRVDHGKRSFRIVKCLNEYGGVGESKQWEELISAAKDLLDE